MIYPFVEYTLLTLSVFWSSFAAFCFFMFTVYAVFCTFLILFRDKIGGEVTTAEPTGRDIPDEEDAGKF